MSVYDDLMRFKPDGVTANGWAVLAGVSRTVWSDIRRHDNPSRKTLEKLLAVAGSSLAEFEALRIGDGAAESGRPQGSRLLREHGATGWRAAPLSPIPVFWTTVSVRSWGAAPVDCLLLDRSRELSRLARPHSLAADHTAFAIVLPDERMWPRFRKGRHLIISAVAPVEIGDDVLVLRRLAGSEPSELAMIGELAKRSPDCIDLRQFTPQKTVRIDIAPDDLVAKVIGEAI